MKIPTFSPTHVLPSILVHATRGRRAGILATMLFGVVWLAAPALSQHHVEYGINLSLGPTYHEKYQQGAVPVGPIFHSESIDNYGSALAEANVGFGANNTRLELHGKNPANPLSSTMGSPHPGIGTGLRSAIPI